MLAQIQDQNFALNEFNQNLEQKVKERTTQLESVNKELEAFSYSISHDLRAPLRGIIGFTAILEEDYGNKLDEEAKRITGIIKNNTLKMGHLIDDLLTFSRMGRQDIVKTNIATDLMIEEVMRELVPGNKMKGISWVIHKVPDVKGDINAMRQVWVNLISNAVKYSGNRDQPVIEIGSFADQGQTVFFVKDNGVGFDEKYKDKLFRVFQRLHSADEFEGTGVGLAIVEKIVSKHGGRVWAEARVDKGATFYFSLPDRE
jgi:light-regulated signal transduction histidine kinase (bacteriophytochrome)